MTDRPLLLLDVDGPLNPYAARLPRLRGYAAHRCHPANWLARQTPAPAATAAGYGSCSTPPTAERLVGLPFELAWATTWMHEANEMIGPAIGLPAALPVIEWPELFARDPDGLYWKTRPLLDWAAGRPFAWVDDMITDLDSRHVTAHHDAPALLLRIHPRHGLREGDFTTLTRWAEAL